MIARAILLLFRIRVARIKYRRQSGKRRKPPNVAVLPPMLRDGHTACY